MSKYNNEVMLGGFIVVAGGLLAYMSVAVGGLNLQSGVHVTAKFTNASGLVKDATVSVAGVQVGHIEKLGIEHDKAVVSLFLRKDANLRNDVKAVIRAKSLLGEKYLELRPQSTTAPLFKDGDSVPETMASVEVDELLAALAPVVKEVDPKDVQKLVHGLAMTIEGESGSLSTIVRNAADISSDMKDILARNKGKIDQIAANTAALTADGSAMLRSKRPEIERTVSNVDKMVGTWKAESPALASKAQRIATNIDHATAALDGKRTARIVANLDETLRRTPPTLDELKGLRHEMDKITGKINPLLDKAIAIKEADVKALANDIFLKGGMRIYAYPFNPPAEALAGKMPAPLPMATTRP